MATATARTTLQTTIAASDRVDNRLLGARHSDSYNPRSEAGFPASRSVEKKMPSSQKPGVSDLDDALNEPDEVIFLRLPEVKAVTGLSKTSLYALIKEKSFPAPVHLGPRAVAWVKSEIRQWALARMQASRSAA